MQGENSTGRISDLHWNFSACHRGPRRARNLGARPVGSRSWSKNVLRECFLQLISDMAGTLWQYSPLPCTWPSLGSGPSLVLGVCSDSQWGHLCWLEVGEYGGICGHRSRRQIRWPGDGALGMALYSFSQSPRSVTRVNSSCSVSIGACGAWRKRKEDENCISLENLNKYPLIKFATENVSGKAGGNGLIWIQEKFPSSRHGFWIEGEAVMVHSLADVAGLTESFIWGTPLS